MSPAKIPMPIVFAELLLMDNSSHALSCQRHSCKVLAPRLLRPQNPILVPASKMLVNFHVRCSVLFSRYDHTHITADHHPVLPLESLYFLEEIVPAVSP